MCKAYLETHCNLFSSFPFAQHFWNLIWDGFGGNLVQTNNIFDLLSSTFVGHLFKDGKKNLWPSITRSFIRSPWLEWNRRIFTDNFYLVFFNAFNFCKHLHLSKAFSLFYLNFLFGELFCNLPKVVERLYPSFVISFINEISLFPSLKKKMKE